MILRMIQTVDGNDEEDDEDNFQFNVKPTHPEYGTSSNHDYLELEEFDDELLDV